jgi:hypothetical protein
MGKPKQVSSPVIRGNTEVAEEAKARVAEAGGRLLAAEADYLTVHGWAPTVVASPGGAGVVYWSHKGTTLRQAQAVNLQKLDDPLMGDRR